MILIGFGLFLLLFIIIGVMSTLKSQPSSTDYLLANRSTKPWLVALSAIATNNSGYMFVGQIGFTYMYGLQSIWLMVGWILGDLVVSLFVHQKLRIHSEKQGALSFASAISRWGGKDYHRLRILGGVITVAFLGTYAAAQLNAGSKALHVLFGWDYRVGAIMGSIMIVLYCFAGGIRASIWTDAAQSFVMILAMSLMCWVGLSELGGISATWEKLNQVSPTYLDWFPQNLPFGVGIGGLLFVLGWFLAGVGVVGQPHIMVRFMSIDQPEQIKRARVYYYSWYIVFYVITIMVALAARLLIPETSGFDAELALPTLAGQLLPEFMVGLVLAGLFAATMSTADSQILACTAAITHDFAPNKFSGYRINKIITIGVTLIALTIALSGNKSVFSLVLVAWSALASAFAPLLLVLAFNKKVSETLAIVMVLGGIGAMLLWRWLDLNGVIYEVAPGIVVGLLLFFMGSAIQSRKLGL